MAESQDSSLKYLGFVQYAILKITAYIVTIYGVAKENSGPLKPGVDSVEGTVKIVVGPVYQKLEGKPYELLLFTDGKVGTVVELLNEKLPESVKTIASNAIYVVKAVPGGVRSVLADFQKRGVSSTFSDYYHQYEPIAESYGVKGWKTFVGLPIVHPTAGYVRLGAGKVNQFIISLKDSQLPLVSYLPLIPLSYIDKAIKAD